MNLRDPPASTFLVTGIIDISYGGQFSDTPPFGGGMGFELRDSCLVLYNLSHVP
jgi:hypothetical protein